MKNKIKFLGIAMLFIATSVFGQTNVCLNEAADVISVTTDRTASGYTYTWSAPAGPVLSSTTGTQVSIDWTGATVGTTYTITLTESITPTAGPDCEGTATIQKIVRPAAPVATMSTADMLVCDGSTNPNAIIVTLTTGNTADWSFTWNDGSDHTVSHYSGATYTIIPAGGQTYNANVTYTISGLLDSWGCGAGTITDATTVVTVPNFGGLSITDN